ncbi:MAG: bifunctional nuclease family protein [Candidatus Magnetomorum sp.]|nr:bifunctional nuclease family protein [Candidatus Magnetomorum sp.]
MSHEMMIYGIAIDTRSNSPIIVLKDKATEEKVLPIWIGIIEASAIATTLQHENFDRPMTHDLFKNFISHLQMRVQKVEITDIVDNAFWAKIFFSSQDYVFSLDARPSDAITMALKSNAPIFASNTVLQESMPQKAFAYSSSQQEIWDRSEEGQRWLDYLDKLEPDAFGKYPV